MKAKSRNPWVLMVLLLVGLVIGGVIGQLLADQLPILKQSYTIGINPPLHLDLKVIDLTFGLMVNLNVASVIGLILAIFIFRKL